MPRKIISCGRKKTSFSSWQVPGKSKAGSLENWNAPSLGIQEAEVGKGCGHPRMPRWVKIKAAASGPGFFLAEEEQNHHRLPNTA